MNRLNERIQALKDNLLIGESFSLESTESALKKLRKSREELCNAISRKRSWKPSERAAAQADYMIESQAITVALNAIELLKAEKEVA